MTRLITFLVLPILFACCNNRDKTTAKVKQVTKSAHYSITPFQFDLYNSNYASAYTIKYSLTDTALKIIFKSELVGDHDSLIYSKLLEHDLVLKGISETNIDSLKKYYANPCKEDGSQIYVDFTKAGKNKHVQLSNYYHPDLGRAITLINDLVLEKYKIWYDKDKLIAEMKNCNIK